VDFTVIVRLSHLGVVHQPPVFVDVSIATKDGKCWCVSLSRLGVAQKKKMCQTV